jgi:hypothetical protein
MSLEDEIPPKPKRSQLHLILSGVLALLVVVLVIGVWTSVEVLANMRSKESPSAGLVPANEAAKGNILTLRPQLNKPIELWQKAYGPGVRVQDGVWKWTFGRIEVQAFFIGDSKVASFLTVMVPYGQNQLTLSEAKQIVASLGLKNGKKSPVDPLTIQWGKEGDEISAQYDGNKGEDSLQIQTSLYKFGLGKSPHS